MMNRYARQMMLPEVGPRGQNHLAKARVLVVGAGGLGCPVLQYLTGAGVGQITLIDPDHVADHNLHRQPLYRMSDIGRPKVEAAHDAMLALNPDIDIQIHITDLGPKNAAHFIETADLVIDSADSFAVSYILSDACLSSKTPFITASILGQSGYIGGFCGPAPSLRAVFPDPPHSDATCASSGVLGPAVGVLGALQAQLALRVLLDCAPSPLGQMLSVDLATLHFGGFNFTDSPEPDYAFPYLSKCMVQTGDLVIELRDTSEAPQMLIPIATRMSIENASTLPTHEHQRVVLCCSSGLRAWRVATNLHARGHRNIALIAARACQ